MPEESTQTAGYFCRKCGHFLHESARQCSKCGTTRKESTDDEFRFELSFTILECQQCKETYDVGTERCSRCGSELEQTAWEDPTCVPLNKRKRAVFGDTFDHFISVCGQAVINRSKSRVITDDQYLRYLTADSVFNSDAIDALKVNLKLTNFTSQNGVKGRRTKKAFSEIIKAAYGIHEHLEELSGYSVANHLDRLHSLILAMQQGLLDLHIASVSALMSFSKEEAGLQQVRLQTTLDRLTTVAEEAGRELDTFGEVSREVNEIRDRFSLLVGKIRPYEFEDLPDYAWALSTEIEDMSGRDAVKAVSQKGFSFFQGLSAFGRAELGEEAGPELYQLALETVAYDNPILLMRRANLLLDMYNQAFIHNQAAVTESVVSAYPDLIAAVTMSLSIGDRANRSVPHDWAIETRRQEHASLYTNMLEMVYNKSLTFLLAVKSILEGSYTTYEDLKSLTLSVKYNKLTQELNPRHAAAIVGVCTVSRNAVSHGDVVVAGDGYQMTSQGEDGSTTKFYTDEEFLALMADLALSYRALALAYPLFTIKSAIDLPPQESLNDRRISNHLTSRFLGLANLINVRVNANDRDTVVIQAKEDPSKQGKGRSDHLLALILAGQHYPAHESVRLEVVRRDGVPNVVSLNLSEINDHLSIASFGQKYSVLFLLRNLEADVPVYHQESSAVGELIRPISLLLLEDSKLLRFKDSDRVESRTRTNDLAELLEWLEMRITSLENMAPRGAYASLSLAVNQLRKGTSKLQDDLLLGRWDQFFGPNKSFDSAIKKLTRISQWSDESSPILE